jgi:hypothetical protein
MHFQPLEKDDGGPVRVPEAVFLDRDAAERERARRELTAREVLNPFWLGGVSTVSSLSEDKFRARLPELGFSPLPPKPNSWDATYLAAWWDEESANWTAEQRSAVWDLLDKVRLFEVVEVELA